MTSHEPIGAVAAAAEPAAAWHAASQIAEPAGGAALDQVALASGSATLGMLVLAWVVVRQRAGRTPWLERIAERAGRVAGLPGWAALPTGIAGGALLVALLGMYWDISLHIDRGRDAGPLANPAHYLILVGLGGVFAAGVLAMALPRDFDGPSAVTVWPGWRAPAGGVLIAACGAFALAGFPLDDVWHRLFGQDVTLWGPTHLMLIGGAGMTLIGQAVLLREGLSARARDVVAWRSRARGLRHVALMGGLLIGLSTFQAEFDFGVPQFRAVLQPALIALAAGLALVAARVWIGPGGALGAAVFFLVVRGGVAVAVGPVFGQTTPSLPLYLPEALAVEAAALVLARRPLALGVAGGLLAGTIGFAAEWGWSRRAMRLPWEAPILGEALLLAAVAGTAGGLLGALLALALRGASPRAALGRPLALAAAAAVALVLADGLYETAPPAVRAQMTIDDGELTARLDPPDAADGAAWLQVTAWQGGGLVVERMRRAPDGSWRTAGPVPLDGDWKTMLRLQRGRHVIGVPVRLPGDAAIPVDEVPARASVERPFVPDRTLLQRERAGDVPLWLWAAGSAVVLVLALTLLGLLGWGLERVARAERQRRRATTGGAAPGWRPTAGVRG